MRRQFTSSWLKIKQRITIDFDEDGKEGEEPMESFVFVSDAYHDEIMFEEA
jgi:hypothetical protein